MRTTLLILIACLAAGCTKQEAATFFGATIHRSAELKAIRDDTRLIPGKVDALCETVGNQTGELNEIREGLSGLKTSVGKRLDEVDRRSSRIEIMVEKLANNLLPESQSCPPTTTPDAIAKPTGKPGEFEATLEYKPSMTIEIDASASKVSAFTFRGNSIDANEWLATPLAGHQIHEVEINGLKANRAAVEKHLRWHGVAGDLSRFSRQQLIHLHSVAHLKSDVVPTKSAAPRQSTVRGIIPQMLFGDGCANGQCARPVQVETRRSRRH